LACTHYPLLKNKIQQVLPAGTTVLSQGEIVANSLEAYLERHPEMETRISKHGNTAFYTTDNTADFNEKATVFFGKKINSLHAKLPEDGC